MTSSPKPLNESVRLRMTRQRRRDTDAELRVRRRLHSMGLRYRVDFRPEPSLRCRGDIVFTRSKIVIFIDGCFWHGCPVHATNPKSNSAWWREKLTQNAARDQRNTAALRDMGWCVLRFWEHEDPEDISTHIVAVLKSQEG
ncbi:very short patch repair endonuclease [Gordonia alkanivorans]|uniref:very short patch repair endonuclease n=1 Tax=Gordonia alkanivorans TaxID=84096 RepID=UPI00244B15F6|nr:very short patch repair endonuclease [Gordonia alkanivorans]MDH3010067.1 very short patch repair endonuclease [Gordonia alkanivorans]